MTRSLDRERIDRMRSCMAEESVDALIRSSREIDAEERRRRAIAAAGRFHSGASDISAKHDEYLVEAFQR